MLSLRIRNYTCKIFCIDKSNITEMDLEKLTFATLYNTLQLENHATMYLLYCILKIFGNCSIIIFYQYSITQIPNRLFKPITQVLNWSK